MFIIEVRDQQYVYTLDPLIIEHSLWLSGQLLSDSVQSEQVQVLFQVKLVLFCVLPRLYKSGWLAPQLKQPPYTRSVLYGTASCLRAGRGVSGKGWAEGLGAIWGNIIRLYVWSGLDETDWSSMRQTGIPHLFSPSLLLSYTRSLSITHTHTDVNEKSVLFSLVTNRGCKLRRVFNLTLYLQSGLH